MQFLPDSRTPATSFFRVKIKALFSSEMLVNFYQTVWRHIRENRFVHFHPRANSKSQSPYSVSDLVYSGKRGLFKTETELIQAKYIRRFQYPMDSLFFPPIFS
jgi:hypothetical protein